MTALDLAAIEALCAAAHDCKPEGQRLVGLPAPTVRELLRVYGAVKEWGEAKRVREAVRFPWRDGVDAYRERCAADAAVVAAEIEVAAIADRLATPGAEVG